jgi:hypothetical protein
LREDLDVPNEPLNAPIEKGLTTHPERRVARSVQVLREGLVDDGALGEAEAGAVTGKTLADFASDVRLDSLGTAAGHDSLRLSSFFLGQSRQKRA